MRWTFSVSSFADLVLKRPGLWLAGVMLASIAFAITLPFLEIDGSIERIMLKGDPEKALHERSVQWFGGDDMVSVILPFPQGVWKQEALDEVQSVSQILGQIEGVEAIYSLTNYPLVSSDSGFLLTSTIPQRLEQGATLEELRTLAWQDKLVRSNLVSQTGYDCSVNLQLKSATDAPIGFHNSIVSEIRKRLESNLGKRPYYLAGWPIIKADLTRFMERDLIVLLPIVALVVVLLLVFSFRRWTGVLLPSLAIGLSLIWTIGGMIITGHPLTIVSNSLPVIVIAVGATYCIYVATHLFRAIDSGLERRAAVRHAIIETTPGVVLSGITTIIGFAALKLNPLDVIDEFGTVAIWGSLASMLMALIGLPVMALYLPMRAKPICPETVSSRWENWLQWILTHRGLVWSATFIVVAISGWLLTQVRVETAPVSWFPRDSQVRRSVEYANAQLSGITPYNIVIQTREPNGIYEPQQLERILRLQQWLDAQPEVDTSYSIANTTQQVFAALGGSVDTLPSDRAGVEQVLMLARGEQIRGLDNLITPDGSTANILLRSSVVSSELGVDFASRVDGYLREHFHDVPVAKTTGNAYLTYRTNLQFTSGFVSSLAFGIGVIAVLMVFVLRSIKYGVMSLVANLIPIAVNYAILGIGDLTLNAATSITGCIALGNAVDSTLHFLISYRKRMEAHGDQRQALKETLAIEGWPMMTTSFALSIGFSVLMLSNFMPVISLGLLVAFTMMVCLICNLALLPILLTATFPVKLSSYFHFLKRSDLPKPVPCSLTHVPCVEKRQTPEKVLTA